MTALAGTFTRGVAVDGLPFYLEDRVTGVPITSGTVTVYIVIDDGGQGQLGAAPAHKDNGQWTVDISSAEMDGKTIGLLIVHPSAQPISIVIRTGTDVLSIANSESAATNLAAGANQLEPFTVGSGANATSIPTGITGAPYTTTDHYEGRVVTINRETRKIFGSGGSPVVLTTEAFNSVPSQNDPGVIS